MDVYGGTAHYEEKLLTPAQDGSFSLSLTPFSGVYYLVSEAPKEEPSRSRPERELRSFKNMKSILKNEEPLPKITSA